MENIILSLLLLKNMTVYEIRRVIQQNLNSVCSDSLGSIQAAMKKLLQKECVAYREYTEKNLIKKEYRITAAGLVQLKTWIQTPMNLHKVKSMEGGKLLFLGMAPKEQRIQSLRDYIDSLRAEREKLIFIQQRVELTKENVIAENTARILEEENLTKHLLEVSGEAVLEQAVQNIYDYQIYGLEYALQRLKDDISFYSSILERELLSTGTKGEEHGTI